MRIYDELPGGEAFPSHPEAGVQRHFIARGMSLRDYFAAKAMQGIISIPDHWYQNGTESIAEMAYAMADAMLEERK
jgi:hypothetical protein